MDTRFTTLFTHSKDVFLVMDLSGILVHTNPSFQETFEYSAEELMGTNIADICHPADKERQEENQALLMVNKKLIGYQSRIKSKNGCYFNIIWSVIFNDDDQLIYSNGKCLTDKVDREKVTDIVQHTIQSLNEGFLVLDANWDIVNFNPAFQAITNSGIEELHLSNFMKLDSLGLTPAVIEEFHESLINKKSMQVQYLNKASNCWMRINMYPYHDQMAVFIRDITDIKVQQLVLALEKHVLELNATPNYTLAQTTNELLKGVEEIFPDMLTSVLEVDDAQEKLHTIAGPRLPTAYCDSLDGLKIGPNGGSCGTATYHRKQIIVTDIEHDPLWDDYIHLAKPYGLKACWSTPVISSQSSRVLATFAIYYNTVREPTDEELHMIERTVNILRVLIESKKTEDSIREQNKRLQDIASISSHDLRRPVATIMGLVNLYDNTDVHNPLNREVMIHLDTTSRELDSVIHAIVEKTIYVKNGSEN